MNEMIPFHFEECSVRIIIRGGAPWFTAADVCKVLEIKNGPDAINRLDDEEKATIVIADSGNLNASRSIINESGLYALILTSRKPEAKRFKRWVTGEVLPSIRRTGNYNAASVNLNDPAVLRSALITYTERVLALEAERDALAPQAEALDRLTHAEGSLTLTAASKALQIGRDALLSFMRSNRWIYRGGDGYLGYADKVNAGLLMHKITSLPRDTGRDRMVEQLRVTPKGLARLATALAQHEVAA